MKSNFFKNLVYQSSFGFAFHKVIFDKNNIPIDYIFLEVNPLFEQLTGLKSENIINKRVTEAIPGITQDKFDWIAYYGNIALNGGEKEFEQFSAVLNKHFRVQVTSPEKGYFVTLFIDISEKILAQNQLKKVLESSQAFFRSDSSEPEYQKIIDLARDLSGARYAILNLSGSTQEDFTTVAVSGAGKSLNKLNAILGYSILNKKWKQDPVRAKKLENLSFYCYDDLSDLIGYNIPKLISNSLEKLFGIKKSAVIKVFDKDKVVGDFLLFFTNEKGTENKEMLEIFAGQVYMYLKNFEATRLLEHSENRLKMLLKNAGEGILGIDLDGNHTFVNPQASKILGFTEEEMIGVNSHTLWHHHHEDGSTYSSSECPIYQTLKYGKQNSKEGYFIHKDGHGVNVNYTSMPIYENGKISGAVVTFIDITERKLAYKKIILLASALKSVTECVSITDLNNHVIFVNDSFLNTYGYSEEEVIGKEISFFRSEDNDVSILKEILPKAIDKSWNGELINRRKDGSSFPILLSASAIRNEKDELIATIGVARDITEQKKAEQTIKNKNAELEELVSTRNKFFSIISHDLRSPFSAFIGLTDLLASDNSKFEEEQQKTILKSLNQSAKKTYTLLENLLQWSRIQQGNIEFDPKILNLKSVVEESTETAIDSAKNKDLNLSITIPAEIEIIADNNMLQLIIRNLLSNAIKFSNKGGKILLNARIIDDEFLEFEVRDTGIGMDKIILDNLFDAGVKTNRTGTGGEESAGLGLLLTKEFIERNGGTIRAESTKGKGSSFYFTLKRHIQSSSKL
ncbi:MAG: PAS domain S-box protein [Bacteroidales bacterium]|nr:PAS domain S-box protein [Bacteroidales bacterium]MCF8390047.1 PAS domain S-box protein [Bacteroidales bacterium]